MQKTILLHNQSVTFEWRAGARTRRVRFAVHPGGRFVVSTPTRVSERFLERLLVEKAEWILAKIELMKQKTPVERPTLSKKEFARLKVVALELVHRRLEYFNAHYRFAYHRVTIRQQKTRWGSCSRAGNLNFNVNIALLPPDLADYIIVHELCHLREMNHSPRFWRLVAVACPNYLAQRRALRRVVIQQKIH